MRSMCYISSLSCLLSFLTNPICLLLKIRSIFYLLASSLKSCLYFSNLPTIVHMEIKTWYTCVFQHFHDDHEQKWFFPITTSSLFKLANHAMHGRETWYACVFQCFHYDHEQKMASGTFCYNYFFTSKTCKPCNA